MILDRFTHKCSLLKWSLVTIVDCLVLNMLNIFSHGPTTKGVFVSMWFQLPWSHGIHKLLIIIYLSFQVIQAYQISPADRQLSPHVYSMSKVVLSSMCRSSKSQCCVFTGDSASGKTESLKHILAYMVNAVVPVQASLKSKFLQV